MPELPYAEAERERAHQERYQGPVRSVSVNRMRPASVYLSQRGIAGRGCGAAACGRGAGAFPADGAGRFRDAAVSFWTQSLTLPLCSLGRAAEDAAGREAG